MEPHKRAMQFAETVNMDEVHEKFHGVHQRNKLSFQAHIFINNFFHELAEIERRLENGISF